MGETIIFTGHGDDPDQGGRIDDPVMGFRFTWKIDGDVIGSGNPFIFSDELSIGRHTVTLTVRDDKGAEGTSASRNIIVQ